MVRRWFPTGWVLMSVDVTISPRKINEADLPSEVRWWPRWSAVLDRKQLAQHMESLQDREAIRADHSKSNQHHL